MRVIGLVSGGKDSCYALMQCVAAGHQLVALATLLPPSEVEESDSFMYQSVGVRCVSSIAESMGLPLYTNTVTGTSINTTAHYSDPVKDDEVEDLYTILSHVKSNVAGGVDGVSVGAILSDYQRVRVEHVCGRLGLVCFAYLWRRDQSELLMEMDRCGLEAVLVKVAGAGLVPSKHCGNTLRQMNQKLHQLNRQFGLHVCGEGGEFETFTTDCPLYQKKIHIVDKKLIEEQGDVGYLILQKLQLEDKLCSDSSVAERVSAAGVPGPLYYTSLGNACSNNDSSQEIQNMNVSNHTITSKRGSSSSLLTGPSSDCSSTKSGVVSVDAGGWWSSYGYRGNCVHELLQAITDCSPTGRQYLSEACEVRAFVRSMADYASFNDAYMQHFGYNPPVRACVQPCGTMDHSYQLDVVGYCSNVSGSAGSDRKVMHVQSISHWAPANIGPYSQAVKVGDVILLAGMIGLVPGSMSLVSGGAVRQATLALRHVYKILNAMLPPDGQMHAYEKTTTMQADDYEEEKDGLIEKPDLLQLLCYYVSREGNAGVAAALAHLHCSTLHLLVERLPKDAIVELHATAHASVTHALEVSQLCGDGLTFQKKVAGDGTLAFVATTGNISNADEIFDAPRMDEFVHSFLNEVQISKKSASTFVCPVITRVFYNSSHVSPPMADYVARTLSSNGTHMNICVSTLIPVLAVGHTESMTNKFAITAAVYNAQPGRTRMSE